MLIRKNQQGFTIVELLVVIVVIGILAAVSIVAYQGIQSRANASAVKSDLSNFAKRLALEKSKTGTYPYPLTADLGVKFTKSSYGQDAQARNARYCYRAPTSSVPDDAYILMTVTKNNEVYKVQNGQISETPAVSGGWGICSQIGLSSTNPQQNGYDADSTPNWAVWTN